MSEASELLKSLSDVEYESYSAASPVNDVIEIDANGRFINIPRTEVLLGVETDKDVERKYFRCPRYVGDNIDLTKLQLRVNYQNAEQEKDAHIVQDVTVDGQYINFSWKLSNKVLAAQGTVFFAIQAVSSEQDGTLKNRWNTTLASGNVLETLIVELDYYEEEQARELLTELLQMMDNKSAESIQKIQNETNTQLGRIGTTGTQQVQAVADEGVRVLESIPADYQETYKMADEGIRTKTDAITDGVESQDTIVLTNAANDPLRGLKLYGKTKQVVTTGKNLFEVIEDSETRYGVTFTVNDDGTINVNGTNTTTNNYTVWFYLGTMTFKKNVEYIISGCPKGGSNATFGIYIDGEQIRDNGEGVTYSVGEDTEKGIGICIYPGITVNNLVFKPMIRLASNTDNTYEPFSGGVPSPNPDYPQELDSLGEMGNLLEVTGENKTSSGITYTVNSDKSVTVNGTCTNSNGGLFLLNSVNIKKGQAYTLSGSPALSGCEMFIEINGVNTHDTGNGKTFTSNTDATQGIYIYIKHGTTVNNVTYYPMLNYGDKPLPWRPYTGQKEIESVVRGKNLFGGEVLADEIVRNGGVNRGTTVEWSCADVPNNGVIDVGFSFKENTPYTFIFYGKCKNPDYTTNMQITFTDDTKWNVVEFVKNNELSYSKMTTPQNKTVKELRFVWATGGTILEQAKCGIFEGVVELEDFEPYCGKSLYTPVSSGLPGMPLGQTIPDVIKNSPAHMSGVYWDEEDQQYYISDTVDYETGKYEQRIYTQVISTNDLSAVDNTYTTVGGCIVSFHLSYSCIYNNNVPLHYSNIALCKSVDTRGDNNETYRSYFSDANYVVIRYPISAGEKTADEAREDLLGSKIQYILATPTTRDLTATEMAAYRALRTNKPTTVIFNDCKARMDVKYNVDLEIKMKDDAAEERYESDLKYGGAIVQTIQGESLVATDSAKAPFLGMKLFGKTEQVTTTGKNLLLYPYHYTTQTLNGVRFTDNGDGSITVVGTAASDISFILMNGGADLGDEYIDAITNEQATNGKYSISKRLYYDHNSNKIALTIKNGATINETLYPMVNAGTELAPYEPYTGGQPSPSPDYPQELKSAGQESGQIESVVYGKNWLKSNLTTSKTLNGITITPNSDGSFSASGTATAAAVFENIGSAEVKKDNTYFLSGTPTGKGVNTYQLYLTGAPNPTIYEVVKRATTVATDGTMNLSFIVYSGQTINFTVYPQLELGSEATAYEPYKQPQSLITKTPNGLPGIRVDVLVHATCRDSNGQMWYTDEIDFEHGKYIQRVEKKVFTGNESFSTNVYSTNTLFRYGLSSDEMATSNNYTYTPSSHFISTMLGFVDMKNGTVQAYKASVRFRCDECTSIEEFKAFLAAEYAKGTPVTVQYILAEPTIRDLTSEELKAFKALRSNYPTTTIMNDANVHMEASYVVDTKTYIDKKFAELAARLSQ